LPSLRASLSRCCSGGKFASEAWKITKVPANLDLTPLRAPSCRAGSTRRRKPCEGGYLDENDTELIKVMQRAMVP
jgi:hypothetical protein